MTGRHALPQMVPFVFGIEFPLLTANSQASGPQSRMPSRSSAGLRA